MSNILAEFPELLGVVPLGVLLAAGGGRSQCPSWLSRPARACLMVAPSRYLNWVELQLTYAGMRTNSSFDNFAVAQVYLPLAAIPAMLFLPLHFATLLFVALLLAPDAVLAAWVARRQSEIRSTIPQVLDLMLMCVDAGLSLDAALQKIGADPSAVASAFHSELRIAEREILLGMDRVQVYEGLYLRTGVDELKTLGSALTQASKLGLSIGRILRSQAEFLRTKLSHKAEEKAMKTPIYMAFPLWLFIMPSLLLLVLGPSLIRFYHQVHAAAGGM